LNANRRPAVTVFPLNTDAVPDGGYPADCAPLRSVSPSSAPDATDTVNVPEFGCDTTVAVCADVADADPAEFDAVTTTCNFEPTSAADTRYDAWFDPTFTHDPPHRCHWYAYDNGAVPDHDPTDADNVDPACANPDTTGNPVFDGATGGPDVQSSTSCGAGEFVSSEAANWT
jgi:hypothetical protein